MSREQKLDKILGWLKKHRMTPEDIGVDGDLADADDDVLLSVLEDIDEDEARDEGWNAEAREADRQSRVCNDGCCQAR